jgi:preprotein translocase subunit SecE
MAIKEKNKEVKQSKLIEILSKEYKWETYALGFLSIVAIALGLLIFSDVLTVNSDTPIIGGFPTLFAWIIIGVGVIGLVLFAIPVFRPAFPELKKLSWPTWRVFVANTTRVFIFLIFMSLMFLLYESFISAGLSKLLQLLG